MAPSELCLEILIDSELSALEDSYVITMLLSAMPFELGVAHILQKQKKKDRWQEWRHPWMADRSLVHLTNYNAVYHVEVKNVETEDRLPNFESLL